MSEANDEGEPVRQLLARIPASLHRDIRRLAIDEDTSMATLVQEALTALLESRRRGYKGNGGGNS